MFGLKSHTDDAIYGVIFDIDSVSVGVSIVESVRGEKVPFIIFSHRVHMRITEQVQSDTEYKRQMREALFSASLIVSRDGLEALALHDKHARIGKILVTCAAPWSHTISRNVHYEGDTEIKISRGLIDDLIQSAESEISNQIKSTESLSNEGFEVVERATIDMRINDYTVQNPIGLKGKYISLSHITGLIPTDVIKAVHEVQEKIFPNIAVQKHTFLLVLYCVLRDLFPKTEAMCIIHVSGETTELGVVDGGTLIESVMIPFGKNTLIRSIMIAQNRTSVEIASLFELLEAKSLTKTAQLEIETHVQTFVDGIKEALREHFATRRFPKTAFLLAPTPLSTLLIRELGPFIRGTMHGDEVLLTLTPEILGEVSYHNTLDPDLTIAARFFHKLHGCGEIESD